MPPAPSAEGETLTVRNGVLHCVAEPFTPRTPSAWSWSPYSGTAMLFAGEGAAPEALLYQNERFARI